MLEQLGKGEAVDSGEYAYTEETIARYKMAVLILSVMAALFFLIMVIQLIT